MKMKNELGPIGIFDSGYGGLTVFKEIQQRLPGYDYIYLGDNARTPYGTRSLEKVYQFTLQGVQYLFNQGCHLVILACNTASANALRSIQQKDLPRIAPDKRVLGVIRPTTEYLSQLTKTGHIGLCATEATVNSQSYLIEAKKYAPEVELHQQACPLWVPLVENNEGDGEAAHSLSEKYMKALMAQHDAIDTVLLACTHYPLMMDTIQAHVPDHIQVISQGKIVADSLADYLERHPQMDAKCSKTESRRFLTTDSTKSFDLKASQFYGSDVIREWVELEE